MNNGWRVVNKNKIPKFRSFCSYLIFLFPIKSKWGREEKKISWEKAERNGTRKRTRKLISIKKNSVIVQITAAEKITNESPLKITLLQAISSGDRMDITLQKAVELGVAAIQPVATERSVYSAGNIDLLAH